MRKVSLLARLTLVCAALCLAHTAAHAQGQNTLEGRVALSTGSPPAQSVRVTLTKGGRRVFETFTDLSGRFNFPGLAGGTYQLTAEGDGQTFETTSVTTDISAFGSAGQSFTQNIQLRPKAGTASPAGRASVVAAEEIDPSVPSRAREQFRKGVRDAADDKPEGAVRAFREAIKEHASFYAANLALAEQLSKLQRYDEAIAAYRRAGELKPDSPDPYIGVGVTLVTQKRYDEGIRMLRGIVEVDKNIAAPYLSLGYAEMMTGDYASAEKHLLRAYDLGKSSLAHIYLANVYEQSGEPAKAVEHLQAYLKENPKTPNADSIRSAVEKLRRKLKDKK
ncbi:MAG: tetratricopeptide repeat protein [Pyrinomonadaceae bacterium]